VERFEIQAIQGTFLLMIRLADWMTEPSAEAIDETWERSGTKAPKAKVTFIVVGKRCVLWLLYRFALTDSI
jgi:hypothetical protein